MDLGLQPNGPFQGGGDSNPEEVFDEKAERAERNRAKMFEGKENCILATSQSL